MVKIKQYIEENYKELVGVFCIFVLALVLRMITITSYGELVLDEIYSWYFASQKTVLDVTQTLMAQDVHTPLYFALLHIWTKLFGVSPRAMHLCSLLLSIPLIPFAYYLGKKHFNQPTGYFASIMLAVSTFCIYYSVQVRFYSLVLPLTLVLGFLYIGLLEKFERKYVVFFIFVHTLLVYTFTLSLLLSVFYFIAGFIYLLIKRRNLKEFILTYITAGVFALPAAAFALNNILVMKDNLCIHSLEFFNFSWYAIYDVLENFFSSENYQLINRSVAVYRNMLENITVPRYFFLVVIPVVICIVALFRALLSKNKNIYLLFVPSILTIGTVLALSCTNLLYFQTKYLLVVFPIVVVCCAYGFTAFKNKAIGILLFAFLIFINSVYTIFLPRNVFSYGAIEVSGNLNQVMNEQIMLKDDDLLISPFISEKLDIVIEKGKMIPFAFDEGLLLKNKKALIYYFGKEKLATLTRKNVKDTLIDDVIAGTISPVFEQNLYNDYIKQMKSGQRIVVISPYEHVTGYLEQPSDITKENYKEKSTFEFLMSKATRDTIDIVQKYLRYLGRYRDPQRGYALYVFEKY